VIQANAVVTTNTAVLRLAKQLGFQHVGTLPRAFRHPRFGLLDAYVLFREL
jgi:hypothetical protein